MISEQSSTRGARSCDVHFGIFPDGEPQMEIDSFWGGKKLHSFNVKPNQTLHFLKEHSMISLTQTDLNSKANVMLWSENDFSSEKTWTK